MNLMEKYRARLNDARRELRPLPSEGPVEPGKPTGVDPVGEGKPELEITAPIPIESRCLDGKTIYLVEDEEQAFEVESQGGIAITSGEIAVLKALHQSTGKDEWVSYLKAVCQAKDVFEGSRVIDGRV